MGDNGKAIIVIFLLSLTPAQFESCLAVKLWSNCRVSSGVGQCGTQWLQRVSEFHERQYTSTLQRALSGN